MLSRLALALLVCVFSVPPFAKGQSACAQLGVNCSQPTIQQRPNDDNSSRDTYTKRGPDAADYAWDDTRNGNILLDRYIESGSRADLLAAFTQFKNALANIARYGPAELGLCRAYEQVNKYREAIDACEIAMQSRFLVRKTKKWIKGTLMERVSLSLSLQQNTEGYAQWRRRCLLTTQSPEKGSTVDPATDIARFEADCVSSETALHLARMHVLKEIAEYNAKHQ